MGKGDRKTRRGKINAGSHGKIRSKKKETARANKHVAPSKKKGKK